MLIERQPILYSALASQWANVPKLGLAEKGFGEGDIVIKEIDLRESTETTAYGSNFDSSI
jgi:hypothetical protein